MHAHTRCQRLRLIATVLEYGGLAIFCASVLLYVCVQHAYAHIHNVRLRACVCVCVRMIILVQAHGGKPYYIQCLKESFETMPLLSHVAGVLLCQRSHNYKHPT
jgi:hypothetical protein